MSAIFEWSAFSAEDPFFKMVAPRQDDLPSWKNQFDGCEAATSLAVEYFRDIWSDEFGSDDNVEMMVNITSPEAFAGFYQVELSIEVTGRATEKSDPRPGDEP